MATVLCLLVATASAQAQGVTVKGEGRFSINAEGRLNANEGGLTVTGSGLARLTDNSSTAVLSGGVSIGASASLTCAGTCAITLGANWTNDGTFTQSTSTVTLNKSSSTQTVGGAANTTFYNLTLSNGATRQFGNNAAAKTFTVSNTLSWSAGGIVVGQTGIADQLYLSSTTLNSPLDVPSGYSLRTVGAAAFHHRGSSATNGITLSSSANLRLADSTASITCGGNWTINSGTSFTGNLSGNGTTTFDGTTNIDGAGVSNIGNLTIANAATVTVPTTASSTGLIKVYGNFSNGGTYTHNEVQSNNLNAMSHIYFAGTTTLSGSGTFSFCSIRINSGSSLTSTAGTIALSGSFTNMNTFTANGGTVNFSGTSTAYITGGTNTSFNSLNLGTGLSGAQSKTLYLGNRVAGSTLTVTAATATIGTTTAGTTTRVILGTGMLKDASTTTGTPVTNTIKQGLTVTGTLTINGTGTNSLESPGSYADDFTVGGNWTDNGSFVPGISLTTFNGGGAQSIGGAAGTETFYGLSVSKGGGSLSCARDVSCNDFDVAAGTFAPGASRTVTKTGASTSDVQSGATLRLANGTVLKLANGATLNVNSGGTLSTTATSTSSRARIENNGAGSYAIDVSGTMDIAYITLGNLAATGVKVNASAILTGSNNWTAVRFTSGSTAAGSLYLDLSSANSSTSLPATISYCQFDDADPGAGLKPDNNVKGAGGSATHSNVTFASWAGSVGGEVYETNDTLDLIDWGPGTVVVLRNGTSPFNEVQRYGTIMDAVMAATAADNIVSVEDGLVRDETVDLSTMSFRVILDGAVLKPGASSTAIVGSGIAAREVLRNVVLIRDAASATPLVQNVANLMHCDILGPFSTANPLVSVAGGNTCLIENSIVGDPGSWSADTDDPISSSGTLTVNYSFVDRQTVYTGTNNANGNPQLAAWHTASGMYDIHLKPASPCVDYAPVSSIAVATDFDRGSDFTDTDLGNDNPRRAIDARPETGDAGGPAYASWDDNFGTYDVGADELGAFVVGTGSKCQGTPVWANRAGAEPASGVSDPVSHSSPLPAFTLGVMYIVENLAASNCRVVAYSMNDSDGDGDLDALATYSMPATIQKVHFISVQNSGGTDNLFFVVDTNDADTTTDAIYSLSYTPSSFSARWGPTSPTASSGSVGRMAFQQDTPRNLLFVRGGWLYRMQTSDGAAPAGNGGGDGQWDDNGRLNPSGATYDGKLDTDGSLFAVGFNNSVYVPVTGVSNEVLRIETSTGSAPASQDCGTSNKNHIGFSSMASSIFVTAADQYVWRLKDDTLLWNGDAYAWTWQGDLGTGYRTTGWATVFRSSDRHVRVPASNRIFRFRRESGVLSADSDASGDDWGPGRTFRGVISTPLLVSGSLSKPISGSLYGAKVAFGTDQGYCYVASYIRDTATFDTATAEPIDDSQPASSGIASEVKDGTPYPGLPYRIPGVKIAYVTLVRSSTLGRDVYVFITDNGWMYGFMEPY